MMPQSSKKTIAIHILPSISRSKGTQTMKFAVLIENDMRNIFFEKLYIKYGGKIIPRPFSKNLN